MSENRNAQQKSVANKSWLFSEPANRAIRNSAVSPIRVAVEALRDIRDNVRRNLNALNSSENLFEPELGANVVIEREFSFGELDNSLIANNIELDVDVESSISASSRLTHRREFSLTSYDSNIFNPDEIYRTRDMYNSNASASQPITSEDIDEGIKRLQEEADRNATQSNAQAQAADDLRDILREMREEMRREIRSMHAEIYDLRMRGPQPRQNSEHRTPPGERTETAYESTPEDVRHRRGRGFLPLKEARGMIPEFDGSPNKLQEFLSATTYAVEHIDPLDEVTLLGAVLCTKLKGRAMLDFQTRKIRDFAQLKNELEACYASKKGRTHLQIEFNTLKQKNRESARTYGLRADKLAMELYESMMEGRHHTVDNKRAIREVIQHLENSLRKFPNRIARRN
ncbi:hypothetical protein ACS0PU_012513 [Formica fusca]